MIHVFGTKQEGALEGGEIECTPVGAPPRPEDTFAEVIYHQHAVVLMGGGWACVTCGTSTEPPPARPLH